MNLIYFSKSSVGYSHLKQNKRCQDFSDAYHNEERTIVTACDGHGGDIYVRSHLGSEFASKAILRAFSLLKINSFDNLSTGEISERLRLNILCEWNMMVEQSISECPTSDSEISFLADEDKFRLSINPIRAYGSTLNGAMVLGDKLICAGLGDGGVFLLKGDEIFSAFDDDGDDEPVANITYSLCQEDAFKHLKISIFNLDSVDGVLVCTDGVLNPYQNLANFNHSFVKPVCALAQNGKLDEIEQFVVKLGAEIGIGDDVSLGFILKQTEPCVEGNNGQDDISTGAFDGITNG